MVCSFIICVQGFMSEHMTVCGGHLSAANTPVQLFSHAKFGDVNYDNKEDCDWIIEAPQDKNVHLAFLTFELEDEQDCGYDFIEVSNTATVFMVEGNCKTFFSFECFQIFG